MLKCLIVDDEPLAHDIIIDYAAELPYLDIVAQAYRPLNAIEKLKDIEIDLIFLDIQMPELTGLELAGLLKNNKTMIIFTTAYPNFAADSYEYDAIDYLVKPIAFDRFLKAVNKAKEKISNSTSETEPDKVTDYIFVKSEYKTVKIVLDDVLFIESLKDYVVFHFPDRTVSSLLSLTSVEEQLPKDKFTRVHRSFIVALDKIDSLERNLIHVGQKTINVSDSYRDSFQSRIEENKLR